MALRQASGLNYLNGIEQFSEASRRAFFRVCIRLDAQLYLEIII
jgi:hypothetical protein